MLRKPRQTPPACVYEADSRPIGNQRAKRYGRTRDADWWRLSPDPKPLYAEDVPKGVREDYARAMMAQLPRDDTR